MVFLLKEVPAASRPRERFLAVGQGALAEAELLALILRTGGKSESVLHIAQRLLNQFEGIHGLSNASLEELQKIKGVGPVKAMELLAVFELSRRLARKKPLQKGQVVSSFDLGQDLILRMGSKQQEHLVAIYLNTKNQIIREETVFVGSLNQSIAHPREIFKGAVRASAANLILAHNHPSNDLQPSKNDLAFTKRICQAGELMGIKVLDHLIIGEYDYFSMKEENLIP